MPIELAKLGRVFRPVARDRDRLPQHRGMSPEGQRQEHERQGQPNRQPDELVAEGFFGAAPVSESVQHQG
jgi:hypothetical protein